VTALAASRHSFDSKAMTARPSIPNSHKWHPLSPPSVQHCRLGLQMIDGDGQVWALLAVSRNEAPPLRTAGSFLPQQTARRPVQVCSTHREIWKTLDHLKHKAHTLADGILRRMSLQPCPIPLRLLPLGHDCRIGRPPMHCPLKPAGKERQPRDKLASGECGRGAAASPQIGPESWRHQKKKQQGTWKKDGRHDRTPAFPSMVVPARKRNLLLSTPS